MTPEQPSEQIPQPVAAETVAPEPPPPAPEYHWYHKMSAVLFITFCLDVGLFLVIFPWTDAWDNFIGYVGMHVNSWRPYIDSMYARGAISGIGMVNLYISLGEVFGLRRFSKRQS